MGTEPGHEYGRGCRTRCAWWATLFGVFLLLLRAGVAHADTPGMRLFDGQHLASVVYDDNGGTPFRNVAMLLSHDLSRLSGRHPHVAQSYAGIGGNAVIIGLASSPRMAALLRKNGIGTQKLDGQWETYGRAVIPAPWDAHSKVLLIFGSDVRGTIWGVIDLTREMGISAWQWWADVKIRPVRSIEVDASLHYSRPPSVKYRGIFLNAGASGMTPWAGKTFDPAFGNIGPKTYKRIYELMWRLKANTIWPAMTDADAPFNTAPGDAQLAADYAIVRGSSHVEMLLRNNAHEWHAKTMGPYNWLTNKQRMIDYWKGAVEKFGTYPNLYTVGLRNVDDFPMQGAKSPSHMAAILSDVIGHQRKILTDTLHKPARDVPQIFTPYKEVLAAYDTGRVKLPGDITIDWPDDDFGYIMRLSDAAERKRAGGSGVYYHLVFWGRPQSFLWLDAIDPSLMWEEMSKAYHFDARRFWMLNVGSIKPCEFLTELYLAMAFDIDAFSKPSSVRTFLRGWVGRNFGPRHQDAITGMLWRYYKLAFIRNPEFMGWNTNFPETPIQRTGFNMLAFGDANAHRAHAYTALMRQAAALMDQMPADRKAAFYQLVKYPLDMAGNINLQQLDLDKSVAYGRQHRASADSYADKAARAHQAIVAGTRYYNQVMEHGKWRHMIGTAPNGHAVQDLPIYEAPDLPHWQRHGRDRCGLQVEGGEYFDGKGWWMPTLPEFHPELKRRRYVDVFTEQHADASWSVESSVPWIKVDHRAGRFSVQQQRFEQRIKVSVDWAKAPAQGQGLLKVRCSAAMQPMTVHVRIAPRVKAQRVSFIESNGIVSMYATHADHRSRGWRVLDGLGYTGADLQSDLDMAPVDAGDAAALAKAPQVSYRFATQAPDQDYSFPVPPTDESADIRIMALPTFPIVPHGGVRIAVSLDGAAPRVLDFAARQFSVKWREHALANQAIVTLHDLSIRPGAHTLTLYALDPGVTLDRIEVDFRGAPKAYAAVPETRIGS